MIGRLPVDVIIPCWGYYCDFLERAITSISDDVHSIIVVGDRQAMVIAETFGVVTAVAPQPFNIGSARQLGLGLATAKAVCFLDADDEFRPSALTLLMGLLEANPHAIAITTRLEGSIEGYFWPPNWRARIACSRYGAPILLFRNSFVTIGSCIILRSAIADHILFPDLHDEDWHAAVALRSLGKVVYVATAVVWYDVRSDSVSRRPAPAAGVRQSHDLLINTALTSTARHRWPWRLVEPIARGLRHRDERRTFRRETGTSGP